MGARERAVATVAEVGESWAERVLLARAGESLRAAGAVRRAVEWAAAHAAAGLPLVTAKLAAWYEHRDETALDEETERLLYGATAAELDEQRWDAEWQRDMRRLAGECDQVRDWLVADWPGYAQELGLVAPPPRPERAPRPARPLPPVGTINRTTERGMPL